MVPGFVTSRRDAHSAQYLGLHIKLIQKLKVMHQWVVISLLYVSLVNNKTRG